MKSYVRLLLCGAIVATTAEAYDDFYARRLALGKKAFAEGRAGEAAEELRVACFGMLDVPEALIECTSRLALAQEAAGRTADAGAALDRFLQLENRFGLFAKSALEPALKASFRDLVKKRKGVDLAATPTPAPLPVATAAPAPTPAPAQAAAPTPAPSPSPKSARTDRAATEAAAVADAKKLVAANKAAAAKSLLVPLATADAGRELRKQLLEAAILTKDYRLATEQGELLAPFQEGEETSMFYAAVALFETGRKSEARALADRCVPKLRPSAYLDYYAKQFRSSM